MYKGKITQIPKSKKIQNESHLSNGKIRAVSALMSSAVSQQRHKHVNTLIIDSKIQIVYARRHLNIFLKNRLKYQVEDSWGPKYFKTFKTTVTFSFIFHDFTWGSNELAYRGMNNFIF